MNIALDAVNHAVSTVRHIFYLVSGQGIVPKDATGEGIVYEAISKARWQGDIGFADIIDGLREPIKPTCWDSYNELLEAALKQFRLNRWSTQDFHLELWTEKDAIVSLLKDLCDENQITIRLFRGQPSDTLIYAAATDFLEYAENGKQVVVLYLGDFDPSGFCIDRSVFGDKAETSDGDLYDGKLTKMMRHLRDDNDAPTVLWERIGILADDLTNPEYADFLLPAKTSDRNHARFASDMEQEGINPELVTLGVDALGFDELAKRVMEAVDKYRDKAKWNESVEEEQRQKAKLVEIIGHE